MFCLMFSILPEAIAASAVCHQRNAIFGRGACIFVLTHFPCRNDRRTSAAATSSSPCDLVARHIAGQYVRRTNHKMISAL
jgi:hypothetical protein